ncbi:MAG TPA: DUF2249 domain-containing protein [Longimicrobiales bacterium]|nr:DUF2249 domain-containing protein [Longimicrobiales bacterium]
MVQKREELPWQLAIIPEEMVVEVDVREDLRSGQEPFARIMAARGRVSEGGALAVRAIFEPVPLYRVLGSQGFLHHTEELGDEDWRVWFYRPSREEVAPAPSPGDEDDRRGTHRPDTVEGDGDVVVLDVRGLEPPEPMVRTLAALEDLPEHATLLHLNVRVPQLLLPLLEERGCSYEVREQEPELVRVFIRRAPPSPDPDPSE